MESRRCLCVLALLIFNILLLFATNTTSSSSPDNDLRALLSFKSFISKDPTGALSSWSTGLAGNISTANGTHGFCSWTGVACGGGHLIPGRVAALRLRGLGLIGSLSPDIGNLTHLRLLDLSDNKLEGEIPPGLASCSMLRMLNLSTNSLSGPIPFAIGHLSKLAVFSVGYNRISGLIPSFANLTALTIFSIIDNSVHGDIPPWFGNLTRLTQFDIQENKMTGHVPPLLSMLSGLQLLGLTGNMLEGTIPPSLFNMSFLERFAVGGNKLSGSLPLDIGFTLPNLRQLGAFHNEFEGPITVSLSNISLLETLVINGNRFRGKIPPTIGINGLLTVFNAANNELTAAEPKDWDFINPLSNCSKLRTLVLGGKNLSGALPNIIANLSQELEYLMFGGSQISGHIPIGIGRYIKLKSLVFQDNLLTGTIPPDIGKLTELQALYLDKNALHGEIPLSLGNITQLNSLSLPSNYLEGRIPVTLGSLSKLTYIDTSNNRLNGQIPQEIFNISSLSELCDLSNNALNGPIPLQIGRMASLVKIDLSSNRLSGEIPNTLGTCLELQFIYLQGNLLQGQIPEDLSALKGLEVLDLSNNKLSGPIPGFLGSFKFLRSLNLSFNQLSGPVPNNGDNETSISLASNGALCGGPQFYHFPPCSNPVLGSTSKKQLLRTLIFIVVGAFSFIIMFIVTCCYVKKLRSNKVGSNCDRRLTFATMMYKRISYAELSVATDSFSIENLIGRGSFSSVYKGILSYGGHSVSVAVKVLDLQQRGASQSFLSECNALKQIRHRKLVKVITVCDSLDHSGNEFKALVLEFISNGNLDRWLHPSSERMNKLSLEQRLSIALDVAEALEYLHHRINPCVAHCDIKPSNILIDEDMTAHIGDFGLAKIMNVRSGRQQMGEITSVGIKGTIGHLFYPITQTRH